MPSVRSWLSELGLESYWGLIEGCGYNTVESLRKLTDYDLTGIGILDANHRRAILNKASVGSKMDDDFNNMLGDLSSVIKDLECFSVPTHIDASSLPTNTSIFESGPPLSSVKSPSYMAAPDTDFDLDSLLNDLTSFDPSSVVATSHLPAPVVYTEPEPAGIFLPTQGNNPGVSGVMSSSSSSTSTPLHQINQQYKDISSPHSTPSSTPTHGTPLRSNTLVNRDSQSKDASPEVILRSNSQSYRKSSSASYEAGESQVVTVPVPDLSGATDMLTSEAMAQRLEEKADELRRNPNLSEEEREQMLKEEKLRIGIEKMRIAHKKRVAIKVFNPDRSNKTVVVEDGMSAGMVCHLLVVKNHFDESPNWVLVEQLGDVSLEREVEDHEYVVDVFSSWPREHNNMFLFKQNERKYDLFEDPIKYFPDNLRSSQAAHQKMGTLERAEKARKILLQEYFSSTSRVPELEGFLHLKDGYKKSWKKVYCILRASGLYYSTKGKQKTAKHLVQLVQFDEYDLYFGINFKKMLKAPSPFCFALRPNPKIMIPIVKNIKVLCCDEEAIAISWTAGIRLAKYGLQLRDNFHKAKLTQFKLEDLAAPAGTRPNVENRASKLVGLRLESHLEKLREQYKAQKEEEECKRQFYHSPGTALSGEFNAGDSSEEGGERLNGSMELLSDFAPDVLQQLSSSSQSSPHDTPPTQRANFTQPPEVAARPKPAASQLATSEGPSVEPNYNPYPPPSMAAPPSPHEPDRSYGTASSSVVHPTVVAPPVIPRGSPGTEKEQLFAYAWYHGSIARDEALARLESMGGFDGSYLVRDSTTVANSYVLTMYAKSTSKNFQIMPMEYSNGMVMYRIDDGPGFSSIDQLLNHYKHDSDRLPCRLTEFCPRPPTRMTEC